MTNNKNKYLPTGFRKNQIFVASGGIVMSV